jgi:hypothetical protein
LVVVLDTTEADFRRALDVQRLSVEQGHGDVPWAVFLVAAVAERHGVAVLHGHRHFDVIAHATGQAVEWAGAVLSPGELAGDGRRHRPGDDEA